MPSAPSAPSQLLVPSKALDACSSICRQKAKVFGEFFEAGEGRAPSHRQGRDMGLLRRALRASSKASFFIVWLRRVSSKKGLRRDSFAAWSELRRGVGCAEEARY